MRTASAARIKGRCANHTKDLPREGGKLRRLYDLLQANKGKPVEITLSHEFDPTSVVQLQDFFGLDIRRIRNGSTRTGRKSTWLLAGEWFGKVYVDYVAERLEREAVE